MLDWSDGSPVRVGSIEGMVREGKSDGTSDRRPDGVALGMMLSFGVIGISVGAPLAYLEGGDDSWMIGATVVLLDSLDGALVPAGSIFDSAPLGRRDVNGLGAMLGEFVDSAHSVCRKGWHCLN